MNIDDIVEVLSASLFEKFYEQSFKTMTTHTPVEGAQTLTIEDMDGNKFFIEVRKL